jgi:hypothetical protein
MEDRFDLPKVTSLQPRGIPSPPTNEPRRSRALYCNRGRCRYRKARMGKTIRVTKANRRCGCNTTRTTRSTRPRLPKKVDFRIRAGSTLGRCKPTSLTSTGRDWLGRHIPDLSRGQSESAWAGHFQTMTSGLPAQIRNRACGTDRRVRHIRAASLPAVRTPCAQDKSCSVPPQSS